ncbi:MAG: hypothetical protein Q7T74_00250 [Candidatus Saccharibacteria bacterium]|nr:hypothetical protein [Candidatus Saccharibacteria bacterium]
MDKDNSLKDWIVWHGVNLLALLSVFALGYIAISALGKDDFMGAILNGVPAIIIIALLYRTEEQRTK